MYKASDVKSKYGYDPMPLDLSRIPDWERFVQAMNYAMMKQYRVVWDFMVTVIGEKYRLRDLSFGKIDLNTFFMRLQEQDDWVAAWSEATITKIKQVLTRVLVENEYLDSLTSDHLNPVLIYPILENAIRDKGDDRALAAFNCFS